MITPNHGESLLARTERLREETPPDQGGWRQMRRWYLAAILGFAALGVLLAVGLQLDPRRIPSKHYESQTPVWLTQVYVRVPPPAKENP